MVFVCDFLGADIVVVATIDCEIDYHESWCCEWVIGVVVGVVMVVRKISRCRDCRRQNSGKELDLMVQYFFVDFRKSGGGFSTFHLITHGLVLFWESA